MQEAAKHQQLPMGKFRSRTSSFLGDGFRYLGGGVIAFLLLWSLWSLAGSNLAPEGTKTAGSLKDSQKSVLMADLLSDPPGKTFYDDPTLSYSIEKPMTGWDEKRATWLKHHPSFATASRDRVLLVTGSQPKPCQNPIGDHLLLRLFKNKVDYCRIHGIDVYYNTALLHPKMNSYWAKLPVIRAAMIAHPEVEWIWWMDSDAAITDMEFKLPLRRYNYRNHNIVVHGWSHLIYEAHSWTAVNAGVFLMRNCQWSMDFMDKWAQMGPIGVDYAKFGKLERSLFKDKLSPDSDDQSALIYLIHEDRSLLDKIYLEAEYYFQGYWLQISKTYDNISQRYVEMERGDGTLRRRHAEKVSEQYGALREKHLKDAGSGNGSWRRPFVTHFTGCQPCNGEHNPEYQSDQCWNSIVKALNFADNQVLRKYGFIRPDTGDSYTMSEAPFDYPEEGPW